jgi:cysteine desulfurase/selenocysteine lyase
MTQMDLSAIQKEFPILDRKISGGHRLIYLDSAATSQKPTSVLAAMDGYYRWMNANIHRGVHTLAEEATQAYESARLRIGSFVGVNNPRELIFTRNTTESINLVAKTWGHTELQQGELIVLTTMEHHSNLVPWQMLAAEKGLILEFITMTPEGLLDMDTYRQLLEQKPKLVAFTHMSNVLGTINPAREIIKLAHQAGAMTLLDAAQSVPHIPVDFKDLDVEFAAFSAHKMCGPTGVGILYGREDLLLKMPPFLGGGDMIKKVELRSFKTNELPHKFEAGTPAIAEAIGFGAAVDFLSQIGMETIAQHEQELIRYAMDRLVEIPGVNVLGPDSSKRGGVASFTLKGIHPHDVAQILDGEGIAVRAGHHCAMPLHEIMGIPASTRASFYLYNSTRDIDALVEAIYKVKKVFHEA